MYLEIADLTSLQAKITNEKLLMNELYRSTLMQLFNVTRRLNNNYFECIATIVSKNRLSKTIQKGISIRFKSIPSCTIEQT